MKRARTIALRLSGLTIGLALLACCARVTTPRLQFPEGQIQITAHSSRPAVPMTSPLPPQVRARVNPLSLPVPGLQAALTPVYATAEARVPSALLDERLAAIVAREEARLDALSAGMEQMNQWRAAVETTPGSVSPEADLREISNALRLRRDGSRVTAEVLWAPALSLREGGRAGTDGQDASANLAMIYAPLSTRERREMQDEAMENAVSSLRRILERTEVSPGETLGQWMLVHSVPSESLDDALMRGADSVFDFELDQASGIHTCSVYLLFDYRELNRLR